MTKPTSASSEPDIPQKADETWHTLEAGFWDAMCEGEAFVRSNPLLTVLATLVVGVVLGSRLSHRNKPTPREKYIDEPLEDFQALARTLSERAARQAGRGSAAAVGAVESILSRIKNNLKF